MKPRSKSKPKSKSRGKNIDKPTGKTIPGKERKKTSKNVSSRSPNRAQKTHSRSIKRKELVSKGKIKAKVHIQSKPSRKGRNKPPSTHAKTRSGTLTVSHPRSKQTIDIGFRSAKSISKKVGTVQKSAALDKTISKQLKRKGGKPPRGVIVSISDKSGIVETIVSKPSLVINEKSVKDLVLKLLKGEKKFKRSQYGSFDERFNPDDITNINIRFVYTPLKTKK